MRIRAFILSILVSGVMPGIAQAEEHSSGDRVYAIFGRHESAAYVRGGNIVQAGPTNSKVEFDSCIPDCYKWISNYSLYSSKYKAEQIVKSMDANHTSFAEGVGLAAGLLAILGIAAAMSDSGDNSKTKTQSLKPGKKLSNVPVSRHQIENDPIIPSPLYETALKSTSKSVNNHLWRASVETTELMPIEAYDPEGGVIITGWNPIEFKPNERIKTNIYVLDKELRTDAIVVSVFKQVKRGNKWYAVDNDDKVEREIESAILSRARKLSAAQ